MTAVSSSSVVTRTVNANLPYIVCVTGAVLLIFSMMIGKSDSMGVAQILCRVVRLNPLLPEFPLFTHH